MSKKFEQLLDYLVNEEMDKANELFHEIVVEKSREIYENMIAEEAEQEESVEEEAADEQEESVEEEAADEQEESVEESYEESGYEEAMDADGDDETSSMIGGTNDKTGGLETDVVDPDFGGEEDVSSGEEQILDILSQLKSEFENIVAKHSGGEPAGVAEPEMDDDDDQEGDDATGDDDEEGNKKDEMMGQPMREYVENVGMNWEKNAMKSAGPVGAGKGELAGQTSVDDSAGPVSKAKGKPTTGATAGNILGSKATGEGTNTGTSPNGKVGGLVKNPQDMKTGNGNVPGGKMGVKNLAKVAGGHGAERKGTGPGPVGSGSGDKAGQTSVGKVVSPLNGAPNRNA